jgi:hypothetical protein
VNATTATHLDDADMLAVLTGEFGITPETAISRCTKTLADGPLVCILPGGHPYGHRYESGSGQKHCAKEEM